MCKKLIVLALMVGLASVSYGYDTKQIGSWETENPANLLEGWAAGWDDNASIARTTAYGATMGTHALKISANNASGWGWVAKNEGLYDRRSYFYQPGARVYMDVTWVASEWDGTNIWVQMRDIALNSNPGWWQKQAVDTANPSYPGGWDPYSWGEVHTRTLYWDVSGYNWAGVEGSWWLQFILSKNEGGDAGYTSGKWYIDNVVITPEPATIAMLGLGGLALIRRKK